MKNPLRKRLPRELKGELGKYLVVFILMVASIGFVSGFLVADNSMLIAYNEGFEKYNIEDGNFRTAEQVHKTQREEIEALGVKLYDNYYVEEPLDNGSTMRFFKNRQQVDKVCLMKGELPARTGEIAIDRMYADNNNLSVGDTLRSGKRTWNPNPSTSIVSIGFLTSIVAFLKYPYPIIPIKTIIAIAITIHIIVFIFSFIFSIPFFFIKLFIFNFCIISFISNYTTILSNTNCSCILLNDCFIVLALTSPIPSTSSKLSISAASIC